MSRMAGYVLTLVMLAPCGTAAAAQNPLRDHTEGVEIRFARTQPVVHYTLRVDVGDLSGFDVELRLHNLPDTFRVAMVAHPEYDDRYWRYVEALHVETPHGAATVAREDSALWRGGGPGGGGPARYPRPPPPPPGPPPPGRPPFSAPRRRAGASQLGHAGRAERGARSRSQGAARGDRARVLPHLEPDAYPSGGIRRRELSDAAAGARVVVERRADDALCRPAAPARWTPYVRLDPHYAPGGADRTLPRQSGELSFLSGKCERRRVRCGPRLARRLQRQHPPPGRAARHDARPDRAQRDARRSLDRRRDARDAGALLGGARVRRPGHRADDRRRMRLQCARLLRDARARTEADRFRPVPATHWNAHPGLMDARAGPRRTAHGRSTAVRVAAAGREHAQPRDHQPGEHLGQGGPAHRRSPGSVARDGRRDRGRLPLDRDPPADWRHHRRRS